MIGLGDSTYIPVSFLVFFPGVYALSQFTQSISNVLNVPSLLQKQVQGPFFPVIAYLLVYHRVQKSYGGVGREQI